MSPKINRVLIPLIFFCSLIINFRQTSATPTPNIKSYLPLLADHQSGWLGPYGGFIVSLAIDPLDPQRVYAGTWGSGVYISLDGGQTWRAANNGLDNLYINSLAIDPAQPSTLYAGTYKSQVYKSLDGGHRWVWSGTGIQEQAVVYALAVDPLDSSIVYAATRGISNNGAEPWSGILYKSVDRGLSWMPSLTDVGGNEVQDWVYSIAINPTDDNSLYVATHEHGPFHSNDYGTSWHSIPDGIVDNSGRAIIINPNTSDGTILYYGVWHFDSVYKSLNGGNDWFLANREIPFTKVYGMALDPAFPDKVYLATFNRGVMKTVDAGENWLAAGLADDFIYTVAVDPITTTRVLAGTAGDGMYLSADNAVSWQPSSMGIENAMTTKTIFSASNPAKLYSSVYGAGVYQSVDRGQSWSTLNTGLKDKLVHTMVQDPAHPNIVFALTDTGGLYKNDLNNTLGWVKINQGLPLIEASHPAFSEGHPFVEPRVLQSPGDVESEHPEAPLASINLLSMAFAPAGPQRVYLGTGGAGVYKSGDGGTSWQSAGLAGEVVQALAVDFIDPDVVYAAVGTPGSLKISVNGGATWIDSSLPVTFYSLAASPTTTGVLYAGTSDGIYRYSVNTWTRLGLRGMAVTSITMDANYSARILVGTTSGAYYTMDSGLTWQMLDWNLKDCTIQSIDPDPADSHRLYISTKTHGIYYTVIAP